MQTRFYRRLTALLLLAALALPASALAVSTHTVTSTNDDGGSGTLRYLIGASGSGDTINFAVTGTITLTGGELRIGRNLTISGPGANVLAISGNNKSRLFNIGGGTNIISNLAIINGQNTGAAGANGQGGAIINSTNLTLIGCVISNCVATGGSASSSVDPGSGYGGAVYNSGSLSLSACTLNGNSAIGGSTNSPWVAPDFYADGGGASGGAIYNVGVLSMTNSTINANAVIGKDGSYINQAGGGNGGQASGGGVWNN